MSRRSPLDRFAALALLASLCGVAGCDEDGKSVPARCLDPGLPLFDPAHAGAPADDNERYVGSNPDNPCITQVGHAVSYVGNPPANTAGSSTTAPGAGGAGGDGNGGAGGGD